MTQTDSTAELIWSLHRPIQASVRECLARWQALDGAKRAQSWLVLHGQAGARHTLDAAHIAELAADRPA